MADTRNKRLSFVLAGCGRVGLKHLKALRYHEEQLELIGLVDSRQEAARTLLQKAAYKSPVPIYGSLAEALVQKPDLVAITTPSGSHYELARAALLAGAHLFVEKPFTLDLAQADQLLELAGQKNLKIAVGHIYRYFPLVQALEADLRRGVFGRVLYGDVKVRWGHDQAYYDAASWRGSWQDDGGVLMNQSIHALDLMTWLLGGQVQKASGLLERQLHKMEAEDLGLAVLELDNKTCCLLEGTTNTAPDRPEAAFTIFCSSGEIRAGLYKGRPSIKVLDRKGKNLTSRYLRRYLRQVWREGKFKALKQIGNPHTAIYTDLIQAIRGDRQALADGWSGRQALAAILAVYAAALEEKTISLPLDFSLDQMQGYFDKRTGGSA